MPLIDRRKELYINPYDRGWEERYYKTLFDIEKYIIPYNFRIVGIDMVHDNMFSGLVFSGDVMYFNKKKIKF